jgi:hypothetical protein
MAAWARPERMLVIGTKESLALKVAGEGVLTLVSRLSGVERDQIRRRRSPARSKTPGRSRAGSTHELYAWSDGGTGRLFGHYDADNVFVFDRLTNHP